jgi:hypothetical protein
MPGGKSKKGTRIKREESGDEDSSFDPSPESLPVKEVKEAKEAAVTPVKKGKSAPAKRTPHTHEPPTHEERAKNGRHKGRILIPWKSES